MRGGDNTATGNAEFSKASLRSGQPPNWSVRSCGGIGLGTRIAES